MRFTRRGYGKLLRHDGTQVSQHQVPEEAYESAARTGPGSYTWQPAPISIVVEPHDCEVPDPDPIPDPIPDPVPDPVPDPAPEPDPVPEPTPDPDPVPVPDPVPEPDPVPTPEPVPDPLPVPEGYSLAPLGEMRILFGRGNELARLRGLLDAGMPEAVRFAALVTKELAGSKAYAYDPWYSALYGVLTGDEAAMRHAVTRFEEYVALEESTIAAGGKALVSGDSYLHVGARIGGMAIVYDWCRAYMTDDQRARWRALADQAIWNVWNHRAAVWGGVSYPWSGWSVNNPRNNYYYSFLRATMLWGLAATGESEYAGECLRIFRETKIRDQLVPSFAGFDGGSQEGTGYGFALRSLFELYDWWEKSTGERIADLTEHTLKTFDWTLHHVMPTLDCVAPIGDHSRESTGGLFDYHRAQLVVLAHLYPDAPEAGAAKTLLAASSVKQMRQPFMYWTDFMYSLADVPARPLSDLPTSWRGETAGAIAMRSSWDLDAVGVHVQCGAYRESHAHHDQGSFLLYKRGPLLWDANTFTHSGIQQGAHNHCMVSIEVGGATIGQKYGSVAVLEHFEDDGQTCVIRADLLPMYAGKAQVLEARREIHFLRRGVLIAIDRVRVTPDAVRVLNMQSLYQPTVTDRVTVDNTKARADVWTFGVGPLAVSEWTASSTDHKRGWRMVAPMLDDVAVTVAGVDGAVASVERVAGAVRVTLADGSIYVVAA